ncbi:hypothetical protein D3C73_1058190 [compost metagenome]
MRGKFETLLSDHVQILRRAFLHVHRVAKQPANHPGINVGLGGLGEQQITARLEHAVKLGQGLFLLHQVMERLVTEQQVDTGVRQLEVRAVAADQLHVHALAGCFFGALGEALRVGIDADQASGRKGLAQQRE